MACPAGRFQYASVIQPVPKLGTILPRVEDGEPKASGGTVLAVLVWIGPKSASTLPCASRACNRPACPCNIISAVARWTTESGSRPTGVSTNPVGIEGDAMEGLSTGRDGPVDGELGTSEQPAIATSKNNQRKWHITCACVIEIGRTCSRAMALSNKQNTKDRLRPYDTPQLAEIRCALDKEREVAPRRRIGYWLDFKIHRE